MEEIKKPEEQKQENSLTPEQQMKQRTEQIKIAREVAKDGKGVLKLTRPVHANDQEINELSYDFSALTGMEYIEAMDSDPNAAGSYAISSRQAITLFAIAAAKLSKPADKQDILRDLFFMDALKAEELAKLFFNLASAMGNQRLSKM